MALVAQPPEGIPPGTYHGQEYLLRACLPDGRIEDSHPVGRRVVNATDAFGRRHFPHGTRFEVRSRVVTTWASEWMPEDRANDELLIRKDADHGR